MSKRGNGEGSLYQRKSDGRWLAAYVAPDGKRRTMVAATRQEASKRLTGALQAREAGTLISGKRQTVGAFLETWLRDSVRPRVRPWTYTGYEVQVRVHIVPAIGKVALDKLTPAQVQELMNRKLEAGLSPKTIRYMRQVLRTALAQAVKWELVARNVAELVDGPKVERHEIHPFDSAEARALLAAVATDRLQALYSVALTMGLRQGEALGLRWEDADLEAGTLQVRHQLQRVDGKLQLVPLKTARSRRTLALPDSIADGLRAHRLLQVKERLAAGETWRGLEPNNPDCYVFTTPSGTAIEARTLLRHFGAILDKAGLRRVRFHDLRHSCASLLLAQ
ncbi:MAG TPA: site-specific integrase, partial [Candidatus Dormibacteraeota bacterium]|nr:site-specific integrase [Candidatus Dormibacteraeota bacterium]